MPTVFYVRNRNPQALAAVYVGRPSAYGNPFTIGRDGSRQEVIDKFRQHLQNNPELMQRVRTELAGRDLACWCAPMACHADVLLEIANGTQPKKAKPVTTRTGFFR